LTLWRSLDIEPEFGIAKRFGDMHTDEARLVLNFRWTRFPWNQYLRISIAVTSGPSFAVDLPPKHPPQCDCFKLFLAGDNLCAPAISAI